MAFATEETIQGVMTVAKQIQPNKSIVANATRETVTKDTINRGAINMRIQSRKLANGKRR